MTLLGDADSLSQKDFRIFQANFSDLSSKTEFSGGERSRRNRRLAH